jgi:hypothetical protein
MYFALFSFSIAALLLASMNSSVMSLGIGINRQQKIVLVHSSICIFVNLLAAPDVLLDNVGPAADLRLHGRRGQQLHRVPQGGARGTITVI